MLPPQIPASLPSAPAPNPQQAGAQGLANQLGRSMPGPQGAAQGLANQFGGKGFGGVGTLNPAGAGAPPAAPMGAVQEARIGAPAPSGFMPTNPAFYGR